MFEDRESQINIANRILDAFSEGYDGVVLSAPTGAGKSAIALQIHKQSDYSVSISSSQKILQDQYETLMKDYADNITLKGQSNYICRVDKDLTVDKAFCKFDQNWCNFKRKGGCEYWDKRRKAAESSIININYHLLFSLMGTPNFNLDKDICVFDECHVCENITVDAATFTLSNKEINRFIKFSKDVETLTDETRETIKKIINEYNNIFDKKSQDYNEFVVIYNLFFELIDHLGSYVASYKHEKAAYQIVAVSRFMSFMEEKVLKMMALNSVSEYNEERNFVIEYGESAGKTVTITPLRIGEYFRKLIERAGKKFVLMSGTILGANRTIETLGLSDKRIKIIELDSSFPIENRKIIYKPTVKIRSAEFSRGTETFNRIIEETKNILVKHFEKDESGAIFVPSYDKALDFIDGIQKFCQKYDVEIITNHDSNGRLDALNNFKKKSRTLLISPSFSEGVNFEDDISRFQIIPKVPFIYWNQYARTKSTIDDHWYALEAIKTIIQFFGRGNRHIDDYSVNYILDSHFSRIYSQCLAFIPTWWKEATFEIKNGKEMKMLISRR